MLKTLVCSSTKTFSAGSKTNVLNGLGEFALQMEIDFECLNELALLEFDFSPYSLVILLGSDYIPEGQSIKRWSGATYHNKLWGCRVLHSFHPMEFFQDPSRFYLLNIYIGKIFSNPVIYTPTVVYDLSVNSYILWLKTELLKLATQKISYAFDLETNVADAQLPHGDLLIIGIASKHTALVASRYNQLKFIDGDWGSFYLLLSDFLRHPNAKIITQKGEFDRSVLFETLSIFLPIHYDTYVAQSLLTGRELGRSLEDLASYYVTDYRPYKRVTNFRRQLTEKQQMDFLIYNYADLCYTLSVTKLQKEEIKKFNLTTQMTSLLRDGVLASLAGIVGVDVDKLRMTKFLADVRKENNELFRQVNAYLPTSISDNPKWLRSAKSRKVLFYDILGYPLQYKWNTLKKIKTVTTEKEVLKELSMEVSPYSFILRDILHLGALSSFLSKVSLDNIADDNRLHTHYTTATTKTLRLSSKKTLDGKGVNLQNIPKLGNGFTPKVRGIFTARPNYTLVSIDLAQADARVFAWEADIPGLKGVYGNPEIDMHSTNAALIAGKLTPGSFVKVGSVLDTHMKKSGLRAKAKIFQHGTHYLLSPYGLSKQLNISFERARAGMAIYKNAYPEIDIYHTSLIGKLRERKLKSKFGYQTTFLGNLNDKKIFNNGLKYFASWIPQHTVGRVINLVWSKIFNHFSNYEVFVVMQVHDELVLNVRTSLLKELIPQISEIFDSVEVPYDEPLVIPHEVSIHKDNWSN